MEEMNYMAPSHSPANSISVESQPHGRVCERSTHKYLPQPPLTPPQRGLSDGDGERMSLSGWLSAAGPGHGHIPALWAQVGGLPLSVGLKGVAWRRAEAQQQDVPLLLFLWHKNTNSVQLLQSQWIEYTVESIKLVEYFHTNVFQFKLNFTHAFIYVKSVWTGLIFTCTPSL